MTFKYDLANVDATIVLISKVRLEIGDTEANSGVLPNDGNLSNEEIEVLLDREGDHVMRTAAAVCELLARHWSRHPDQEIDKYSEDRSQVAAAFSKQAAMLRDIHGYGSEGGVVSVGTIRADGYSTDIPSDAVASPGDTFDG